MPSEDRKKTCSFAARRTTQASMTMEKAIQQDLDGLGPGPSESVDEIQGKNEQIVAEDNNNHNEPKVLENDSKQDPAVDQNSTNSPQEEPAAETQKPEVSHVVDKHTVEDSSNADENFIHETPQETLKTEDTSGSKEKSNVELESGIAEVEKGSVQPAENGRLSPKTEEETQQLFEPPVSTPNGEEPKDQSKNETETPVKAGDSQTVKVAMKKPVESEVPVQNDESADSSAENNLDNAAVTTDQPEQTSPVKTETSQVLEDTTAKTAVETPTGKPAELAIPQSHEIVIPSYARWFHLQKIHSIEKQSLPEFFTNRIPSKTPQVYVKYRNFMVNSYRLNPNEFFTMTAARRNLCGDAGAILRIHKFLMKWGLINYQVDAKTKPRQAEPPFTGDFTTKHDAPRGLFPFESYKPAIQIPDLSRLKKLMHQIDTSPGETSAEENSSETKVENDGEKKRPSENDSESLNRKSSKIQRSNVLDMVDKDWSKEDLEKLLQGLQKYKSDWQRVAHFVGNKTAEQCILRFLQLPIEDPFLQSRCSDELGPLKYAPHLPFSKADNPVMSTIAFLIGLVDPDLVKKMTDRAIYSIGQDTEKAISQNENYVKEGSELALATLGARSHVFATNEERHMNALANEMNQIQMQKVNLKLQLLSTLEKSLEMEKKVIQKQQEDTLIQRLSLAKHSNSVNAKLQQCLDDFDDKTKLQAHLDDLKELQNEPARTSIGKGMSSTPAPDGTPYSQTQKSLDDLKDPFVKPVSVDAPQAYRYWSG
ncbi:LAME_0G03950g1_1 [Lachancea meyersii CBS 8951]|uniref:LAME_0G03950g1_1 n=1 Tax=Lachancea meyersii CBS 8951 TaxID=1266667 RepID=A0A1G4K6R5_9SACH|nr:LAME_0G03950g1_1 [Lachancea meyersii CBS 8951]